MPDAEWRKATMVKRIATAGICVLLAFGIQHSALAGVASEQQAARTLRLLLLVHEIGAERSTVERSGPISTLVSHFEYKDRGLPVALDATLTYRDDFIPVSYKVHGRSYRYFSVNSDVESIDG